MSERDTQPRGRDAAAGGGPERGSGPAREPESGPEVVSSNFPIEPDHGSGEGSGDGARSRPGEGSSQVSDDLDSLVEQARQERDEYLELAQRTKADFENYRRRMSDETASALLRGRVQVAEGVIHALDNLERSIAADGGDPDLVLDAELPEDAPIATQGLIVAFRDLHGALEKAGIEAYSPLEEEFDPSLHEALQAVPVEGALPGHVVEVLQRGYRAGEHVIRAARVVVSQ